MAKFVIAGSSDCPYTAKLELLADQLCNNLPNFQVHKIILSPEEWGTWLENTCQENNWTHTKSPIVWRELVERGGKGLFLGGFNEFVEYAEGYYGVSSDMMTDLMLKIKDENVVTKKELAEEENYFKSLCNPITICIVNASSPVCYNLLPSIASGEIFGAGVEVAVNLVDNESSIDALNGIAMEIEDFAFPLLRKVDVLTDVESAFTNATAVIILDRPSAEEESIEAITRNAETFQKYAAALDATALSDVKVILSGSGCVNFNAHVLVHHTTNIPKQNIVVASRLLERRARSVLASKLKVRSSDLKDAIVWGNCSNSAKPESFCIGLESARVHNHDGAVLGPAWFSRPVLEVVDDNKWLETEFRLFHNQRKGDIETKTRHASSMSEAASIGSLLHDWIHGGPQDEIYSLGVESEGWYGVSGCVFSLPVRFTGGSYQVVWDMDLDADRKDALQKIEAELKKDVHVVFEPEAADEEIPNEVFGEESELITSMIPQQMESPLKTPGEKLEVIQEDEEDIEESVKE